MAIGFMSFGGMLTGGEDEAPEEKTALVKGINEKSNVTLSAVETSQIEEENKALANNTKVIK